MTPEQYSSLPPAPVWRRLAALSYDTLLLMALSLGYIALATTMGMYLFDLESNSDYNPMFDGAIRWVVFAGWILVIALFFGIFWSKNGQTLGMQAWKIRLQDQRGELISLKRSMLRLGIALMVLAIYLIGATFELQLIIWASAALAVLNYLPLFSPKKHSLSGMLSNTYMVRVPKDQREGVKSGGVF